MIGIYKITNNITNKSYIGQSGRIENRLSSHKKIAYDKNHKQYNDELYCDIRKYGIENFSFDILETFSLDQLEEKWIQKEVSNKKELYNKNLKPFSSKNDHSKIFTEKDINDIISLLEANDLSNIEIAKIYNCGPSTIDNINNGKTYKKDNKIYPIRQYKKIGQKNKNAIYSDEEVLLIRKEYTHKTLKELFEIYGKNSSCKSFERMVCGKSYSHIPYYVKRTNQWITDDMQYRLEP